ncbi:MAG: hypothetical protein KKH72_10715 [Alphaproteobacteria bacterium]|nr:hypothetical protein [Alphaproteobacteria bacterium]
MNLRGKPKLSTAALALGLAVLFSGGLTNGGSARVIRDFTPFVYDTDRPEELLLEGNIGAVTPVSFAQVLQRYPQIAFVSLQSAGGMLYAALPTARQIRSAGLRSTIPAGAVCHSSCAFLFFAGIERTAEGELGVHQLKAGNQASAQYALADVRAALKEYEIPDEVFDALLRTPPERMHVYSPDQMRRLGLIGGSRPPHNAWRSAAAVAVPVAPSFDCVNARSRAEKLICANAELAARDRELAKIYADARERSTRYEFTFSEAQTPAEWFSDNTRTEWRWREDNCLDANCLLKWYAKRKALLSWLAYSDDAYGDYGIESVRQLRNGDTIISYGMATHTRNVFFGSATGEFITWPDGTLAVLSESPLLFIATGQKSYFEAGGAFWYSTIRDQDARIVSFPPEGDTCMSKNDFVARTSFTPSDLALVRDQTICVER